MKNVEQAQVTHIYCENYIEVAILENGEPGPRRCVAEDFENSKRGDLVEVKPAKPWNEPIAKYAYAIPVALFLLGLLGFCVAWLMNRRARLRRRLEYQVVRVTKRADSLRDPSA